MKQTERIIEYMKANGSITALEAMTHLHIGRLAARISDLKDEGYDISSVSETSKNEYGVSRYARYFLEEKGAEDGRQI